MLPILLLLAAADDHKPEDNITAVPFSLVLVDPGSNDDARVFPSMQASLGLTEAFEVGGNEAFRRVFSSTDNPWLEWLVGVPSLAVWNFVTDAQFDLPFGAPHQGFLHEEWHRAVMSSHGIDTFDSLAIHRTQLPAALQGLYTERAEGSVLGATDDELARFKALSPGDYVRMSTAGIESQGEIIRRIERDQFFFFADDTWVGPVYGTSLVGVRGWNAGSLWLNVLSSLFYLQTCASPDNVDETAEFEKDDPGDELSRDFTGFDCVASVYDMHRPREPYAARGVHPSGVGVDRYRTRDDLSAAERRTVDGSAALAWLSLADPALLNIGGVRLDDVGGRPLKLSGRLNHVLSPIGSAVEAEVLAQRRPLNAALLLRAYLLPNDVVLPAAQLSVVRVPLVLRPPPGVDPALRPWLAPLDPLVVTASLDLQGWLQPHDLIAVPAPGDELDVRPGGMVTVDVGWVPLPSLELIASFLVKSEGFAPGVLATGPHAGAGLTLRAWLY